MTFSAVLLSIILFQKVSLNSSH